MIYLVYTLDTSDIYYQPEYTSFKNPDSQSYLRLPHPCCTRMDPQWDLFGPGLSQNLVQISVWFWQFECWCKYCAQWPGQVQMYGGAFVLAPAQRTGDTGHCHWHWCLWSSLLSTWSRPWPGEITKSEKTTSTPLQKQSVRHQIQCNAMIWNIDVQEH